MNRTATLIFVAALCAVSLLEVALAALNYLHHGRLLWIVGPLVLALGLGVNAFGGLLRGGRKPPAPSADKSPAPHRFAGPGGADRL